MAYIRFGIRNVSAKTFRPEDLGLTNDPRDPYAIEVRVKYFHILYIPFFPVGKVAVVLKSGGKMYDFQGEYRKHAVDAVRRTRNPWFTFLGPMIILLGLSGWMISERVARAEMDMEANRFDMHKDSVYRLQILHPDTFDLYYCEPVGKEGSGTFTLRVRGSSGDSVFFEMESGIVPGDKNALKRVMPDSAHRRISCSFSKKDLAAALNACNPGAKPLLIKQPQPFSFHISSIKRKNGIEPDVKFLSVEHHKGGKIYMEFENMGDGAAIGQYLAIENIENIHAEYPTSFNLHERKIFEATSAGNGKFVFDIYMTGIGLDRTEIIRVTYDGEHLFFDPLIQ